MHVNLYFLEVPNKTAKIIIECNYSNAIYAKVINYSGLWCHYGFVVFLLLNLQYLTSNQAVLVKYIINVKNSL